MPSKPSSPKPRRSTKPAGLPGAQPGNTNALKHGFYSRRFNKRELADLEIASIKSLEDEISLLRLFSRRLVEHYSPGCDLYDTAYILRVLCFSSSCINRMLKTQSLLASHPKQEKFEEAFEQALDQALKELGVDENWLNPSSPPDARET